MKKGFTLLELIVVIIVLGVLASIAVPKYFEVVERARTSEAVSILGALRSAQMRRYAEKAAFAGVLTDLDVSTTGVRFYTMGVTAGTDSSDGVVIAAADRNGTARPTGYGAYKISIKVGGDIVCSGGDAGACAKLGYAP